MGDDATTCTLTIEPQAEDPLAATDDPLAPLNTLLWTDIAACFPTDEE
jgi:hypothetical protein